MIPLFKQLLSTFQGARTYLAGALLAGLSVILLALGGDTTFAVFLLAQGGGLAALRSAIGRVHSFLATLEQRLDVPAKKLD